ncbi:MAG: hypothetical protein EBY24_13895 [Betaproteobacteria bacterium]|nr:hypothetical protein [Betaproteobacteria bacterium]
MLAFGTAPLLAPGRGAAAVKNSGGFFCFRRSGLWVGLFIGALAALAGGLARWAGARLLATAWAACARRSFSIRWALLAALEAAACVCALCAAVRLSAASSGSASAQGCWLYKLPHR